MGSYETIPDDCEDYQEQVRKELLRSVLKPLVTDFLQTLDYKPPSKTDHSVLRSRMLKYAASSEVPYDNNRHAQQCFATGLSVAGVSEFSIVFTLRRTSFEQPSGLQSDRIGRPLV